MSHLDSFLAAYEPNLRAVHAENPDVYQWPIEELPLVVQRMRAALIRGTYSKNSLAYRRTCKQLGIAFTYKAINAYIREGG